MEKVHDGVTFQKANPILEDVMKTAYNLLLVVALGNPLVPHTLNKGNLKIIAICADNCLYFSMIHRNGDKITAFIEL